MILRILAACGSAGVGIHAFAECMSLRSDFPCEGPADTDWSLVAYVCLGIGLAAATATLATLPKR